MIRTKGEPGTGDVVQAVRHMRRMNAEIRRLQSMREDELFQAAKEGQLVNRTGAAVLAGFAQDAQTVNAVGGFANSGAAPGLSPEQAKKAQAEAAAAKAFNAIDPNKK